MPNIHAVLQAQLVPQNYPNGTFTISADGDVTIGGALDTREFRDIARLVTQEGYALKLVAGALHATIAQSQ